MPEEPKGKKKPSADNLMARLVELELARLGIDERRLQSPALAERRWTSDEMYEGQDRSVTGLNALSYALAGADREKEEKRRKQEAMSKKDIYLPYPDPGARRRR